MHPITLLQTTPVEEIKKFCEVNHYALNITGTGELVLVHEMPQYIKLEPRPVQYVKMNTGALKEILYIASIGGTVELTKATDGTDIILGTTPHGYQRLMRVEVATVKE